MHCDTNALRTLVGLRVTITHEYMPGIDGRVRNEHGSPGGQGNNGKRKKRGKTPESEGQHDRAKGLGLGAAKRRGENRGWIRLIMILYEVDMRTLRNRS
jgi:hypothetical protein